MCGVETLKELKILAEDDENVFALLQGIVLLLSNNDPSIVLTSLEIFCAISKKPQSYLFLRTLVGFREQLMEISNKSSEDSNFTKCIQLSKHLLHILDNSEFKVPCLPNKQNISQSYTKPTNVVLQLRGLTSEEDVNEVCSRLLKVRGVVSITFQLDKHRAIVCTIPNLNTDLLIRALNEKQPNSHELSKEFSAKLLKKKPRQQSLYRKRSISKRSEPPSYLDENADLFEVDETKAAPKLKSSVINSESNQSQGPMNWLSDFLERSFFW